MGFLNVKTSYSVYKNCMLRLGKYMMDESLAVEIYNRQDGEIARLTTCLLILHYLKMWHMWTQIIALGRWLSLRKMVWQRRQGEQKEVDIVFIRQ